MAFKMNGWSAFTKETPIEGSKHDTGGVKKVTSKKEKPKKNVIQKVWDWGKDKPLSVPWTVERGKEKLEQFKKWNNR